MADLDPETFEAEKYADYFSDLQTAYRRAFNRLNERYDSQLVHAIDQQVLAESEPFYEGDGEFRVELPDEPVARLQGVVVDREKAERVIEVYVEELQDQLQQVFDVDQPDGDEPEN